MHALVQLPRDEPCWQVQRLYTPLTVAFLLCELRPAQTCCTVCAVCMLTFTFGMAPAVNPHACFLGVPCASAPLCASPACPCAGPAAGHHDVVWPCCSPVCAWTTPRSSTLWCMLHCTSPDCIYNTGSSLSGPKRSNATLSPLPGMNASRLHTVAAAAAHPVSQLHGSTNRPA